MQWKHMTTAAILAMAVLAPPVAALAGYEGAIAFSQRTGASGWAKNYDSKRDAYNAALDNCNANDCKVVYTFTNSCSALAADPDGAYGVDWDVRPGRAERKALRACQNYSNSGGCSIVVTVCSQNR